MRLLTAIVRYNVWKQIRYIILGTNRANYRQQERSKDCPNVRCLSIWIKNNSETIVGSCAQWANWTEVNYPSGWATSKHPPSLPSYTTIRFAAAATVPSPAHVSTSHLWELEMGETELPYWVRTQLQPQGARRDPRLPWFAPKWPIVVVGGGGG